MGFFLASLSNPKKVVNRYLQEEQGVLQVVKQLLIYSGSAGMVMTMSLSTGVFENQCQGS